MTIQRFVDSPVKVSMFFLALLLLGVLSYRKLPLNLFPDIQTPRITLVVTTKGLTPEEAERRLTADIERQLFSIKGVAGVTSYSREAGIVLHVDFHWGQDMEFAYLDVKKSIGAFETNENVEKIDVYRFDPNAASLMTLAFTGGADRAQLTSLIENSLKPRLETIKGVAYVKVGGGSRQEVKVLVDGDVMTQYQLTPEMLVKAIQQSNIKSAGGVVIEGNEEMSIKFISRMRRVEDVGRIVLAVVEGHPIHLADLGKIEIGAGRDEIRVRQDGVQTVSLDIYREPDANAVQTARLVREYVAGINNRGDLGLKVAVDQSVEVEASIGEVVDNAILGMILAVAVLIFFLRDVFSTTITALAIPISVIASFVIMFFQGLSLNIMTLGGLALGVGMLVDNAIVVVEDIVRHRQEGASVREAAIGGTREVAMAVTASTLTTIVVFVPLVYVHGIAGILFKDQALTVVYSLLMSLLVALVLVPMLSAHLTRSSVPTGGSRFNLAFGRLLGVSLRVRWAVLALFALVMAASWDSMKKIPTEFFPESVGGRLSMVLEMPLGTPLETTEQVVTRLEAPLLKMRYRDPALAPLLRAYESWQISGNTARFLGEAETRLNELARAKPEPPNLPRLRRAILEDKTPARFWDKLYKPADETVAARYQARVAKAVEPCIIVRSVTASIGTESGSVELADEKIHGPHSARLDVVLNPVNLRELSAADVIARMRAEAAQIPDLRAAFESRNEFLQQLLGKNHGDVVIEVHADELKTLRSSAAAVAERLRATSGLTNARTNLVLGDEEIVLEPDADAMLRGQFQSSELSAQIEAYLGGKKTEQFKLDRGEMQIAVSNAAAETRGFQGLLDLPIVSAAAKTREKLSNLVQVRRERGLREVMRVNQERTLLVMADLKGGRYDRVIAAVRRDLDASPWQRGASWNVSGEEVNRRESFQKLFFALVIAIVLVYMVIAAILESVIHPLTIMLSVPFALTGVVAGFLFTGVSLNLMGYIGIVMLVGIVVNNAIVLLDRINQLREGGAELAQAVILASRQRIRPILMTSLTTILGLVPLALGVGNGAELRRPMAVAVIGGLTSSTLLTLLILPAIYLCVEDILAVARRPFRRATRGAKT